jgi:transcriptional regulator with XRE-family HTH domain
MITAAQKRSHARMFGKAVFQTRKELGLTTEELAEKSGLPLALLGRIETGAASGNEWGLREICVLADVLDSRVDWLMAKWEHFIEEAGGAWWQSTRKVGRRSVKRKIELVSRNRESRGPIAC